MKPETVEALRQPMTAIVMTTQNIGAYLKFLGVNIDEPLGELLMMLKRNVMRLDKELLEALKQED